MAGDIKAYNDTRLTNHVQKYMVNKSSVKIRIEICIQQGSSAGLDGIFSFF